MNDHFRGVHSVKCPHGHSSEVHIVLPRRSPLGICEGLDYLTREGWPTTFLCINCGRLSVHSRPHFGQVAMMDQNPPADLWKIDFRCDQESCGKISTIYTAYVLGAAEVEVKNIVFRVLST